jgi:apolipoprotein N-acyltransferase
LSKFSVKQILNSNIFYEVFNSAIFLKTDGSINVHHKSKLVPGTESIPFPKIFGRLSKIFENMGGINGSLGRGDVISVFNNSNIDFSTSICYESIFGEFISQSFLKGSQCLFVITNDGWWRDSPGYKQHLSYSRLRAIENRKSVIRCANTGVSCFIDIYGNIDLKTDWWTKDTIRKKVSLNNKITFYSKHGDYIGRISVFLLVLILLYSFVFNKVIKQS